MTRHLLGIALAFALAGTLSAPATPAAAAQRAQPGTYAGTLLDDGKPVKKEFVRFRVKKKRVVRFKVRAWVHCYSYPNTYTQLPVVVKMPKTKIRKNKIDRSWKQRYKVDGERYTLNGRVKLKFTKKRKVTGRVSIDFANCATRLGDPPHWVKLRAKKK